MSITNPTKTRKWTQVLRNKQKTPPLLFLKWMNTLLHIGMQCNWRSVFTRCHIIVYFNIGIFLRKSTMFFFFTLHILVSSTYTRQSPTSFEYILKGGTGQIKYTCFWSKLQPNFFPSLVKNVYYTCSINLKNYYLTTSITKNYTSNEYGPVPNMWFVNASSLNSAITWYVAWRLEKYRKGNQEWTT